MSYEIWGYVAFVFGLAAYVPYNIALWRKTVRPRISSWIVWASLDWTSFAGMLAKSEINGAVVAFCIGATITLVHVAMRVERVKFDWIDKLCLLIGLLAVVLWCLDGDPTRALVLMAIGLFAGTLPTIVSVFQQPENENFAAWSLYGMSVTCGLFAVSEWTMAKATTPVVFALCDLLVLFGLIRGVMRKRDPVPQP